MYPKRRRTKGKAKTQKTCKNGGNIEQFLTHSQPASPASKMAEPCVEAGPSQGMEERSASPAESMESDSYSEMPVALQSRAETPLTGLRSAGGDTELWALLKALPTKTDIESLLSRTETQHHKEIQEVRGELQTLSTRLSAGETSVSDLEHRVADLEHLQNAHIDAATMLHLHMEEREDRSRRNNLCLRGLPEMTGHEDLAVTAADIFHKLPGDTLPQKLEFDWIYRALGPCSADPNRPRDVICRLHHCSHIETITRKAWEASVIDFVGTQIKILPDVSWATHAEKGYAPPGPGCGQPARSYLSLGISTIYM